MNARCNSSTSVTHGEATKRVPPRGRAVSALGAMPRMGLGLTMLVCAVLHCASDVVAFSPAPGSVRPGQSVYALVAARVRSACTRRGRAPAALAQRVNDRPGDGHLRTRTRGGGLLSLQSRLRSFHDEGIDWCSIGYDADVGAGEEENVDLQAMAACLSYSGRRVEWVGDAPRTEGGKAWKKLVDVTDASACTSSRAEGVLVGGAFGDSMVLDEDTVERKLQALFKGTERRETGDGEPRPSQAERVVDAYSSFLGHPPPPMPSVADLQLAELALFNLDKVLLPGADLPLQVDKRNYGGKEMMDMVAASEARRFGIVTDPGFLTRPSATVTERTISDPASASASGGGPSGAEGKVVFEGNPAKEFRRDAQGQEIYQAEKRTFTRFGCMAQMHAGEPTRLDDGRYIVETTGSMPFRVVDIVQQEPYTVAIVQIMRDTGEKVVASTEAEESDLNQRMRTAEIESWKALNDVCWLACELFDKRSWLPLLMNMDGKKHPLYKIKQFAPEERQAGAPPMLTQAAAAASWRKRQQFSWDLIRVLRHGVPGLWDVEYTGNKLSDAAAIKMLQEQDMSSRLVVAEKELKNARYVLRQHQRLRDIAGGRDSAPGGFS